MAEGEDTTVVFQSKEGEELTLPYSVAKISGFVVQLDDDDDDEDQKTAAIPFSKATLSKVVEFCKHYATEPMNEITPPFETDLISEIVQPWYYNFIQVETRTVYDMIEVANYLSIKPMSNLFCLAFARLLVGKSDEEIRVLLGMSSEWTEENKNAIMNENSWAIEASKKYVEEEAAKVQEEEEAKKAEQSSA